MKNQILILFALALALCALSACVQQNALEAARRVFEAEKAHRPTLTASNLESIKPAIMEFMRASADAKTRMVKKQNFASHKLPIEIIKYNPDYVTYNNSQMVLAYVGVETTVRIAYVISDAQFEQEVTSLKKHLDILAERISDGVWVTVQGS